MAEARGMPLPTPLRADSPAGGRGLLKRTLSTVVLLPAFLAIVLVGPAWLFGATLLLVGAAGQWEFTGMFERAGIRTRRVVGLVGGLAVTASFAWPSAERLVFAVVLLGVLGAAVWRPRGAPVAWEPVALTALGICYVNWLLGHGFWLRDLEDGREWVLLLIWVTWLGETAAYVVGSSLGRRALAPLLSPRKTVEGAVAQFLVSVAAAVVAQAWFFPVLSRGDAITVGVLLGAVGQVGDLVESALKRSVGTKDTGRLIPGHGGVLDRIDSLLFNTPVLFYYAAHGRILGS